MTIKEIEQLSGMTRANIRYYETEGLLTPIRSDNGYRDYSPDDLLVLQRIRLLRAMGMSLEDIKAIQSGRMTLSASLYELEQQLSGTQERLNWAKETCRILLQDNVTYETLDAVRYFDRLPPAVPQETTAQPAFRGPWRRYFARWMDLRIYEMLITIAITLLFRLPAAKVQALSLLWDVLALVTMGIVEPLLVFKYGTTLGKWLLGLHITDLDGQLPSYEQTRARTWGALLWGFGLGIPIFDLIRGWISYHDAAEGRDTEWENDTVQYLRKPPAWRYVLAVGIMVALLVIATLTAVQSR